MGLIEDFIAEHPKEMELAQMRRREVKKLLADYDRSLREQIAREIEADPDATHISIKLAAAIARGEPNQVTKDAIEEARNRNE